VTIRARVDPAASLGDLVRSVHAAAARALAQQELPFARVVELVKPDRHPARLPLVQVMFAMEESWAVPDRGGLRWTPELVDNGTAKFELELTVTDAPGGPRVHIGYNSGLFREATGQLVAQGFDRVLRCLASDPSIAVADAEVMPPGIYDLVSRVWPDGGPVTEPGVTAALQLWRACSGDSVVITGSDGALTGAALRDRAQQIAAALRGHGVGVCDRVAVLLPRGARILPAILGIWSAGACYLPLDPATPSRRLAVMLGDAQPRAAIIDSSAPAAASPAASRGQADPPADGGTLASATGLAALAGAVIDLAALPAPDPVSTDPVSAGPVSTGPATADPATDGPPPDGPVPGLPPAAPAFMIFTSGTTGRPKAVTVTQGAIAALMNSMRPALALGPQDRLVAVASFAFDISVLELIVPVLDGGCVIVAGTEQVRDGARLRELLVTAGATAMQATPTGWRMLVAAGGVPAGVTVRVSGGEPLPRYLADAIGDGPGARLWNMWGPTETTIYSGGAPVEPSPAALVVGSFIEGTRLYVLDGGLRPVPPGVLGEIYVGGVGLAQGYHGAPGLTASRFLPDRFSDQPGARLYRTGDLGRWRWPGRIEIAGRVDRQIKIRGYRMESDEVEAALRAQPGIAEAVVSLRGSDGDPRLVGYLVTRPGGSQPPPDLSERLREMLPDYMVPAAFVVLDRLPLTGNRKIDYRALPDPEWGSMPGRTVVPPRTPVESQIAALMAELLGLPEPPGVTDNFFALGGHSLTATRLMARIGAQYGIDLPVRTLFSDPTVVGLAVALTAARSGQVEVVRGDAG
jgi:amino acid adenylation domain-containing protein